MGFQYNGISSQAMNIKARLTGDSFRIAPKGRNHLPAGKVGAWAFNTTELLLNP